MLTLNSKRDQVANMIFSGKPLVILLFVISPMVYGNKYYVSNNGNDTYNGLTIANAWKTIAKLNATLFYPGDSILFECNGLWRDALLFTSSGNSTVCITYGSYGEGEKPKIFGSVNVMGWTNYNGNF